MLFNWFKKKDKLVPLDSADSGQPAGEKAKPDKHLKPGIHGKPFGRPAGSQKAAPPTKGPTKINTSESTVIRIGKLGEVLLQYDMISRENLEKGLAIQQQSFIPSGPQDKSVQKRKLLGEILIENNFVTEEQLLSAFARHCRIPYIKLNKYGLPKEAIKSVPEDLIIKHKVMPIDKIGSMLMLAVTDPYDTNAVEEVKTKTGLKVKTILCKQSEFAEMLKFYYPHSQDGSKETPADIASATAPKETAPGMATKPVPAQETERLGEETAVFKIEELPFPEPPASAAQTPAEAKPAQVTAEKIEKKAPATPTAPEPQTPPSPATENKKESFLGGTIEEHTVTLSAPNTFGTQAGASSDHRSDRELEETVKRTPLERNEPTPVKPEAKTEPAPEVSPQPSQAQKPESPAQQPPETAEINGYDTSLIDIRDLLNSQETSSNESIEILPEEPEPIDVAPYIYPEAKEPREIPSPKVDVTAQVAPKGKPEVTDKEAARPCSPAGRPAAEKTQPPPIPVPPPEAGKAEKKTFKENPVLVSEDEFLVARQLFTAQLTSSWEKLYHRSKPSHAEKVDETEFVFYTENAIHQ